MPTLLWPCSERPQETHCTTTTVDAPPTSAQAPPPTTVKAPATTATTVCLTAPYVAICGDRIPVDTTPPVSIPSTDVVTAPPTTTPVAAETTTALPATSIARETTTALVGHPGPSQAPPSSLPVTGGGGLILVPIAIALIGIGARVRRVSRG